MKKTLLSILTLLLIFMVACAPAQEPAQPAPQQQPSEESQSPPAEVVESVEEEKEDEQVLERVVEDVEEEKEGLPQGVPAEVQSLLAKGSAKSLSYSYRGPETELKDLKFFVKGNNVRYIPDLAQKSLDREDTVTAIYINKKDKTIASYCDDRQCLFPGKKEDLAYEDANIFTPYDWRLGITSAQQVGQEKIDRRATLKIETNRGTLWLDTFYGVPLRVEADGELYEFKEMSFNDVKDEDVVYSP